MIAMIMNDIFIGPIDNILNNFQLQGEAMVCNIELQVGVLLVD